MKSNCLNCSAEIIFMPSQKSGKYCNNQCQKDYEYKTVVTPRIESGEVSESKTLKRYLKDKHGYHCRECGISNWKEKDISLHIDHIDGNSDNNFPGNLRLLCPNCHSQTPTFCGRNIKNSKRSSYRKRYRIKKLYRVD